MDRGFGGAEVADQRHPRGHPFRGSGHQRRKGAGTGQVREVAAVRIGRTYVANAVDVDDLAAWARRAHVRAFSLRVAWAAAALADGQRPCWLRDDELSRLRSRLSALARGAVDLDAWATRLAKLSGAEHRLQTGPHEVQQLYQNPRVVRGGHSATNVPGDLLAGTGAANVWVAKEDLAAVRRKFGLLTARLANVVANVPGVAALTRLGTDEHNAFRLVVVAGLARSRDTRTRACGRALLEQTLKDGRWQLRAGTPSRHHPTGQ